VKTFSYLDVDDVILDLIKGKIESFTFPMPLYEIPNPDGEDVGEMLKDLYMHIMECITFCYEKEFWGSHRSPWQEERWEFQAQLKRLKRVVWNSKMIWIE